MKRIGNLIEPIADYENLRLAFAKACRGKRHMPVVRRFSNELDRNLTKLRMELLTNTVVPGRAHQFVVHDPKTRIITAPCFRDRVLHHAVMNVCESIFERRLIEDTFACRKKRGRIVALKRAQEFSRRFPAYLKLDVQKYFDSISHSVLEGQLRRVIKDPIVLELFGRISHSFRGNQGLGIPIGSLISQHLANLYLDPMDRFIKEELRIKGYVRYMDDMLLWGDSTREMVIIEKRCLHFAKEKLALSLKPQPQINRTSQGIGFLGCRVFSDHLRLNRTSKIRLRRKIARLECQFGLGVIGEAELQSRATALIAFSTAGGTKSWRIRRKLIT